MSPIRLTREIINQTLIWNCSGNILDISIDEPPGHSFYMFSWLLLLLSWYSNCYHNRLLGCCGYNHDTVARKVNLLYLCIPYFFNRNSSLCLSVWHVTFWEICALFKTSFDLKETPKYFFDQIENCRRGKSKSEFYNQSRSKGRNLARKNCPWLF